MMHSVDIDDEVYDYLKSKAEPFKNPPDTPNSVLRRLLLKEDNSRIMNVDDMSDPFPGGTPMALKQILMVINLVDSKGLSRLQATHKVANYYRIALQTVIDKYTRQLNLTTAEFDRLLTESDRSNLARQINNKIPGYDKLIAQYLS